MTIKTDYDTLSGWSAWVPELEESSPTGYGRTELEAIQNLRADEEYEAGDRILFISDEDTCQTDIADVVEVGPGSEVMVQWGGPFGPYAFLHENEIMMVVR